MPPAPAPTTAIRAPGDSCSSSPDKRARNRPIGFTGSPPADGITGSPPTSIESKSNWIVGRPVTATCRSARSIAVASAKISRRVRRGGERRQIDMRLFKGVVAANQTGQHAGIRRLRLPPDERQAHSRFWPHGKATQHLDMCMTRAQQDKIGADGLDRTHGAA